MAGQVGQARSQEVVQLRHRISTTWCTFCTLFVYAYISSPPAISPLPFTSLRLLFAS